MVWIAGAGCLLLWGALWLLEARWKALPAYHRPRLTHSPAYAAWAGAARKTILVTGLLCLQAAHPWAAAAAALLLCGAWAVRSLLIGPAGKRREIQRAFDRVRAERPGASDVEILYQVVYARHQRWGPELVQQIVQENPSVEEAARVVARMERELIC
jgi:hypothetical protein